MVIRVAVQVAWEKPMKPYIGVKGDFVTILVGTEDTVYEWIDVTDQFETLSTPTEIDVTGEDKQLSMSPP